MSGDQATPDPVSTPPDPVDLLPPGAEETYDRYTRLAAGLLRVPVAQLNLITPDGQLTRSGTGGPRWDSGTEVGLDRSYCQHVVGSGEALLVEDARTDPRVAENRATREAGIVAYLGTPVRIGGHLVASLCGVDFMIRQWTDSELAMLEELATGLGVEIDLRREVERQKKALAGPGGRKDGGG